LNHPLPCLNSDLFGFSCGSDFDKVSRQILDLYRDDKRSALARNYLDQPFFNYAVAKSKLVEAGLLSGAVAFVGRAQGAAEFSRPSEPQKRQRLILRRFVPPPLNEGSDTASWSRRSASPPQTDLNARRSIIVSSYSAWRFYCELFSPQPLHLTYWGNLWSALKAPWPSERQADRHW
jgi:hypothetical protein